MQANEGWHQATPYSVLDMLDTPGPTDTTELIAGLRRLQAAGRHIEALASVQTLLRRFPENRDAMLIKAISQRHLRKIDDALLTLAELERLEPRYSLMQQELGLCHVARKDAPRAIDVLLRAVNLNPALPHAWTMLEGLYRLSRDSDKAAIAAAHVATLRQLPPEVVAATSFFSDGDLLPAEQLVRAFLLKHGDHVEAMRLLAKIGMARDVLDDAETLLEAVIARAPEHRPARYDYAQCLLRRHKYSEAKVQAEHLLAAEPANQDFRSAAATAAVGLGEHERAIAIYQAMLAQSPNAADIKLWLGHAYKTVGRVPDAVAAYRAAIADQPGFGDAYWSLANLKTYRFGDDEIEAMRRDAVGGRLSAVDRQHVYFALGKALEDAGDLTDSWSFYEHGNALKRAESRYRPEIIEGNTRQQIAVCTRDFLAARAGWGCPDPAPIFVLGLPRSGSTLIEQILASHSAVEGTQELADIQRIVLDLQGRDPDLDNPHYPSVLADLTRDDVRRLGEKYLADTRVYRSGKPFFVDKMPNNFRHIGLVHLMLPNARIIDARREPMACCFSNLKQLFANGQEFTYSVQDIARYYRTYLELMRHWDNALPERVLRVQHEDVIDDLEGSVRRILDHCGLPFEDACLSFHENRRSVRTPSSEQVRQPIFRDGLDQWQKFEAWLGPLKENLGDALNNYRD